MEPHRPLELQRMVDANPELASAFRKGSGVNLFEIMWGTGLFTNKRILRATITAGGVFLKGVPCSDPSQAGTPGALVIWAKGRHVVFIEEAS